MNDEKARKKIIFLNQVAGYMMIDIVNSFAEKYDECILLTGELRKRRVELNSGVVIKKLKRYNHSNNFGKVAAWIIAFIQSVFIIAVRKKNVDLFITSNPPLGVFLPSLFRKNKFFLLIYDVYPDVLTQFNIKKKNSILVRFWKKSNRKIFSRAEKIFTISEGMKKLISGYVNPEKISVVNCWADNVFFKPVDKNENIFLKEQNLQGKFLVMYSGKLGYTHDVEVLAELAEKTEGQDIFYMIIGEGDKKKMLENRIRKNNKNNIRLLPWQDISVYPQSLAAADVAVVSLGKYASDISVPSKLYDMMAVGVPVLSLSENDSELSRLIDKYKFGRHFSSNQVDEMLIFIYEIHNNSSLYLSLKQNSLAASREFTPVNAKKFVQYI